tara:strand:- start:426 stop:647 length:222 start_codon:yes stop_codon:yes gene_type:complete
MSKNKRKKPTMKDVRIAIDGLISRTDYLITSLKTLDKVTIEYIKWKGDTEAFQQHVTKTFGGKTNEQRNKEEK